MQQHRSPLALLLLGATLLIASATAFAAATSPTSPSRSTETANGVRLQPGVVIVKFTAANRAAFSKSAVALPQLAPVFARHGVNDVAQMYPQHGNAFTMQGREIGLDRMYRVSYTGSEDPRVVAAEIAALPGVEYADPERIFPVAFVPNEPRIAQQYALGLMKVQEAWDVTTGSRDVVIGIVDSGVHWQHEDLRPNIWINPGEDVNKDGNYTLTDINGVDDDGNGYVDDIIGIDFAGPTSSMGGAYYDIDPAPTPTGNNHGTHVAGITAAVGDNGKGIAGVAYNCRILPVKCGTDDGGATIIRGYDGIVYAADMGARVINCSWGGSGSALQSEQDRILYAQSKGAVVVAASGNDGKEDVFTPASYNGVLSVASVGSADRVSSYSNYGTWVDVSAPGEGIVSSVSQSNSAYAAMSGTSMASPQVAGLVALVASHRPTLDAEQLAEVVRVTSENIVTSPSSRYYRKVGYGRVNALRALTLSAPSVRLVDWHLDDSTRGNNNGIVDRGETILVTMTFKNVLDPTKSALVTLSSPNTNVTIANPEFALGALGTGQTISNASAPFEITMADVEALNETVPLNFVITDDGYNDYGGVQFFQQPTYRDHTENDILTTVTNDGNIGFDDFSGLRGKGFIYKNNTFNVLFEGALMIGAMVNGARRVVDVARDESGSAQLQDFIGAAPVLMSTPGPIAAQEGVTEFTDNAAPVTNRLGVRVKAHSYQFNEPDLMGMIIMRYEIENTSQNTWTGTHVGIYFDWDIGKNAFNDYADFDTTQRTGVAWARSGDVPTVVGVTALNRDVPLHYMSMNNPDNGSSPNFGVHDGYTKTEKYLSMSSGILKRQSNVSDISQIIGSGPWTLAPGEKAEAGFALFAGFSRNEVVARTPHALDAWKRITGTTSVAEVARPSGMTIGAYPHPASLARDGAVTIAWTLPQSSSVRVVVHDLLGRVVHASPVMFSDTRGATTIDLAGLTAGSYLVHLTAGSTSAVQRIVVVR